MPDGVIRQRRNFLLCSLIVSGFLFLDLKVTDISIFGIKIEISNADNILWVIIFFWAYFFWRFYQYSHEVIDFGVIRSFHRYYDKYTKKIIGKITKKQYPRMYHDTGPAIHQIKRLSLLKAIYDDKLHFIPEDERTEKKTEYKEVSIEFNRLLFIVPWLRACFSVIIHERDFSDYLLPYIIGGSIFIYIFLFQL